MTSRQLGVPWTDPAHSAGSLPIEVQTDACTVMCSRRADATRCADVIAPDIAALEDSSPARDSFNLCSRPAGSGISAFLTLFFYSHFPWIRRKRYSASTAPVQHVERLDQSPHRGRAR